ncbi:unnamed protein product [Lymnaea stagnalis]|uniref:Uncharacterized protein n=1 Tax=Lymnaea stagnalis TaxID=6523 RepID=A0AAV2I4V3_LYMST
MNMIVLSTLALVMAFCTTTDAVVCATNFCELADCAPITNCNGKVVKNGGFCGCCDLCVTVLKPGDTCFYLFMSGMPSTVTCPDHYHCDSVTSKCVAVW